MTRRSLLALAILLLGTTAGATPPVRHAADRTAVFAGGCYWGVEAVFRLVRGVRSATSGFARGGEPAPASERGRAIQTGSAEAVRVVYDPSEVSYEQLLAVFFLVAHDPTQLNRQGPDVGPQYRSAIFYSDDSERRAIEAYVARLESTREYPRPIVTEIAPLRTFQAVAESEQDYVARHPDAPYVVINERPKFAELRRRFPELARTRPI